MQTVAVSHVSKAFGATQAVADVTFEVARGEIFGLLSPNGARKTTPISVLSCLTPPTSGEAGAEPGADPVARDVRAGRYLVAARGHAEDLPGRRARGADRMGDGRDARSRESGAGSGGSCAGGMGAPGVRGGVLHCRDSRLQIGLTRRLRTTPRDASGFPLFHRRIFSPATPPGSAMPSRADRRVPWATSAIRARGHRTRPRARTRRTRTRGPRTHGRRLRVRR